jgi:hypothetical protein
MVRPFTAILFAIALTVGLAGPLATPALAQCCDPLSTSSSVLDAFATRRHTNIATHIQPTHAHRPTNFVHRTHH